MMKRTTWLAAALFSTALIAQPAAASTPFAGEDFDGGAIGGFTAQTPGGVFTPDNSMTPDFNDPMPDGMGNPTNFDPGNFPSSGFDLFGILGANIGSFIPQDIADDTVGPVSSGSVAPFPADSSGIIRSTDTDNLVAIADTQNDDNGGAFNAVWTFDISGRENIEISIDMAMQGDFEQSDDYVFSYSIDGGTPLVAFDVGLSSANDALDIPYGLTMESGAFIAGSTNGFFDEGFWLELTAAGPFTAASGEEITFDPADDGITNGDTTAQDGFIRLTIGGMDEDVRSFQETNPAGTFENPEFEPFQDPLFVNGTQLTNEITTYTAPIVGVGSVLTLELAGQTNGGGEFFVFDDIVLSGDEATAGPIAGDFNGDGFVDGADYAAFRNLLEAGSTNDAAGDDNGVLDGADLAILIGAFGTGNMPPGSIAAAPEPASLLLLTLATAGVAARRRRSA